MEAQANQADNDPATLYGQTPSAYNVMKVQADVEAECYERQLEKKNDKIRSLKKESREQQGRISYLEVICLQHEIAIDEQQQHVEKEETCGDIKEICFSDSKLSASCDSAFYEESFACASDVEEQKYQ